MKWGIIILVAIAALAIIYWVNKKNFKDEKDLENHLNNDTHLNKVENRDPDAEETTK